ncbi:MAG TPA: hypothetical protein VNE39_00685 [Planctomycetota bacterium]|nr:hypothetical protein [Planctomycetota bacterium]
MSYKHSQVGTLVLVLEGVAVAGILGLFLAFGWHPVGIVVLCILGLVAVLFGTLTVAIEEGWLVCRFGPGLVRKRWPLADVREVRVVRNPWYYGWGIHYTPHGWLYNVSGLGAVEIVLASGKKARIGSDEPEKLAEAIRQSIPPTES